MDALLLAGDEDQVKAPRVGTVPADDVDADDVDAVEVAPTDVLGLRDPLPVGPKALAPAFCDEEEVEAAEAHDRGEDLKALHARCSIAKLYASEAAYRIADRAVQIFGGRGYMRENCAERFSREIRVDRIWEGASEVQRLIIARALARRGLEGM